MKISTFIAAAVVAGAAGVVAGTYFTTGKGSKMIRKGMYKDYLMDNFYDQADTASHPFDNLEVETIRLSKKGKAEAEEVNAEGNK